MSEQNSPEMGKDTLYEREKAYRLMGDEMKVGETYMFRYNPPLVRNLKVEVAGRLTGLKTDPEQEYLVSFTVNEKTIRANHSNNPFPNGIVHSDFGDEVGYFLGARNFDGLLDGLRVEMLAGASA